MLAEKWNKKYPVGTKVKYFPYHGSEYFKETMTRSEAREDVGHGVSVVKIIGNSDEVNLERLEVVGNYECRRCHWIGDDEGKKEVYDAKHSKQCGCEVNLLVCPNCGCGVFNLIKSELNPIKQEG